MEGTFAKIFPKIFSTRELLRLIARAHGNKHGNILFVGIKDRRCATCCDTIERRDLFADNGHYGALPVPHDPRRLVLEARQGGIDIPYGTAVGAKKAQAGRVIAGRNRCKRLAYDVRSECRQNRG
jgi:hypothetical protein